MEILGYYKPENKKCFFPKSCYSQSGKLEHEQDFTVSGDEYVAKSFSLPEGKWFAVWKGLIFRYNKGEEVRLLEHLLNTYVLSCDKSNFDEYFDSVNHFSDLVSVSFPELIQILSNHDIERGFAYAFRDFLNKSKS
jgi:hypothetical protein